MKSLTGTRAYSECSALELGRLSARHKPDFWRWAFDSDGQGVRTLCCRNSEAEIEAYIAALRVPACIDGQPAELLQIVDAYAGERVTRGLRNPGRFVELAEHFARNFGGNDSGAAALMYGLPTTAFWRIAKERLSAKVMRTQSVLRAPLATLDLPSVGPIQVEQVACFPENVGELKTRALGDSSLICRPSAAALNRRFANSVGKQNGMEPVQIALATQAGRLVGYVVVGSRALEPGRSEALVWDWCVPGSDVGVCVALLDWIRAWASKKNCRELCFVLPDTRPEWVGLQELGFRVEVSRLVMTARHFPRRLTMRWLYHSWNYSLSDWMFCCSEAEHLA